ncbi:hypothetical protein BYT27DRAFT_7265288 [Phlegmacium glaucopus]|nr:hypothetical protein BYT27DRAFT_7265288 [Phlegmacium glaucopus]
MGAFGMFRLEDRHRPDFDFWEFVSCAKCQLLFSLDGAAVPFWLTECGHVICNNHLNPDQSCSQCGTQGIQLAPLQQEMEAPMSEWFGSVSMSLDSIAFMAKFQQETMASQIRYYKTRHQQLKHFVERLKRDVVELKKTNGVLQSENDQLRMQVDHRHNGQAPSNAFNSNGKRQMSAHHNKRPTTNSSPHSIPTPLGPNRLTLAPGGQQLPELSSREQHNPEFNRSHAYGQENQGHFANTLQQRPISSRALKQYEYVPPDTSKFQVQQLSYPHADPKTFQNTNQLQSEVPQQGRNQGQPAMPPTSRFTPALGSKAQFPSVGQAFSRQTNMGPPPTPQRFRAQKSNRTDNLLSTNHLLPPPSQSRQKLQNTDTTISGALHQSSDAASQRFFHISSTPSLRGSSLRPSVPNAVRMPFVPEGAASPKYK